MSNIDRVLEAVKILEPADEDEIQGMLPAMPIGVLSALLACLKRRRSIRRNRDHKWVIAHDDDEPEYEPDEQREAAVAETIDPLFSGKVKLTPKASAELQRARDREMRLANIRMLEAQLLKMDGATAKRARWTIANLKAQNA